MTVSQDRIKADLYEACRRIEAVEGKKEWHAISLDLRGLHLPEWPEALFRLNNLVLLRLGKSEERKEITVAPQDLSALGRLTAPLEMLLINGSTFDRLDGLEHLQRLKRLDISGTKVTDLAPISTLEALTNLYCHDTGVSVLSPLRGLSELGNLDVGGTAVADLTPLAGLKKLQRLDAWSTTVHDLSPLSNLYSLRYLDCSRTSVRDLTPVAHLPLGDAIFSGCQLDDIPEAWLQRTDLILSLQGASVPGIPSELLTSNCLRALPAHFADLAAGDVPRPDAKVIVLGNGSIGKTQLCRRLRGEPFQERSDTTHGIRLSTAPLPQPDGDGITLSLWDFGGQELYHGTHALFMRGDAIFLTLWAPEQEDESVTDASGNRPLQYWTDYVRHTAEAGSPLTVVQTRCDTYAQEVSRAPVSNETAGAFAPYREVKFSAHTDYGRGDLEAALRAAVGRLREKRGAQRIGLGRLTVQKRIEGLRRPDGSLPENVRLLDKTTFHDWCAEAGGVSDPDRLLDYFNATGLLFYRPGLFGDRVVLDHAWALNGIYTIFDRTLCYGQLKREGGRFTRPLLDALVWREANFSKDEQRLFLSMMESCGICFVYQRDKKDPDKTVYIAPELLPDRAAVQADLDARWGDDPPSATATYRYPLMHPGIVRTVIARIGDLAGLHAVYWRTGVHAFETTTRSHALIEEDRTADDTLGGLLRLSVRGGQSGDLLVKLQRLVKQVNNALGLTPQEDYPERHRHQMPDPKRPESPPPKFGPEPAYYVSYAWGTEEDERQRRVEDLCEEAKQRGISIIRDKTALSFGDRFTPFMEKLGQGQRIFIFLSDKYLHSSACAFELSEIWRNSRMDDAEFCGRVRVYILPCAKGISTLKGRGKYIEHWEQQAAEDKAIYQKRDITKLSPKELTVHQAHQRFADNVGSILYAIADTLQPRTWDDFLKYGFEDLDASGGSLA